MTLCGGGGEVGEIFVRREKMWNGKEREGYYFATPKELIEDSFGGRREEEFLLLFSIRFYPQF